MSFNFVSGKHSKTLLRGKGRKGIGWIAAHFIEGCVNMFDFFFQLKHAEKIVLFKCPNQTLF